MIEIVLSERDFDYEIQALVNSFFPNQKSRVIIEQNQNQDALCRLAKDREDETLFVGVTMHQTTIGVWTFCGGGSTTSERALESFRSAQTPVSGKEDFHKREGKLAHPYRTAYKNQLKSLLFDLLRESTPGQLPAGMRYVVPAWGTMTGVRPTKIPMNQLLAGQTVDEVKKSLEQDYRCAGEKADLCLEIAQREADLLRKAEYENGYSLYVGIPFCPTTCMYCSFPSYSLEQFGALVSDYLDALEKEIRFCGERMKGRRLTSIYIGGGTPTTLTADELTRLIACIRESFPVDGAVEFTVEAGRPDSITREKLWALKKAGVERISVNPQTMQDATLQRIGRRHSVAEVKDAFRLARECGFDNINMDLIIGLPGETVADFGGTLRQVEELEPDSVTIHSLVIKRASKLRELLDASEEGLSLERAERMEQMFAMGQSFARQHGYNPYYMYRQKNSAGYGGSTGQENIGFAKAGKECLYNILIMEEMQSILAVGAGASTKYYDKEKKTVSRVENVKSVTDYINRIDEMLERKRV